MEMTKALTSYPGFKFSPTDEELVVYYLSRKIEGLQKCVEIIPEIDITKQEPWELPEKSVISSNNEWYFFATRGRRYPKGLQSKRGTASGYWKVTGKERNVRSRTCIVGTKKTLVFHKGRAPKGKRTEWVMHEYYMSGAPQESFVVCRIRKNSDINSIDNSLNEINETLTGESTTAVVDDIQQKNAVVDDIQQMNAVVDDIQQKNAVVDDIQQKNAVVDDIQQTNAVVDDIQQTNAVVHIQQKNLVVNDTQQMNVLNGQADKDVENKDMVEAFSPPNRCYNPHAVERLESNSEYEKRPGSLIFQHSTNYLDYEFGCDKKSGNLFFQDESCSLPKMR